MYKDKEKQKEANRRAKQRQRKGMTLRYDIEQGMTQEGIREDIVKVGVNPVSKVYVGGEPAGHQGASLAMYSESMTGCGYPPSRGVNHMGNVSANTRHCPDCNTPLMHDIDECQSRHNEYMTWRFM